MLEILELKEINNIIYEIKLSDKTKLSNFLKIVMNSENIHYDFSLNRWIIYKKNLDKIFKIYPYLKKCSCQERKKYSADILNIGKSMKLQPYLYQKEAINFALNNQNSLLIYPCGSGKTAVAIGLCLELYERKMIYGKCLILTKASLKYQWCKEFEKFSDLKANIIETPSKIGTKKFNNQFKDCDIFVANYETLKNKEVSSFLLKENLQLLFADEIQYCNSHTADRTKALYKFNSIEFKVGATATPITNNPGNLFGIFNFIKPDLFKDWKSFSTRYLRYVGYKRPPAPKNEEELAKKIAPFMLVKSKNDIADQLPQILINKIYCTMTPLMEEVNSSIMLEMEDIENKVKAIEGKLTEEEKANNEQLNKLKSLCMSLQIYAQELVDSPRLLKMSDSNMAKKYYIDEESTKLGQCIELVGTILSSGEKVCIFTKYERMQQILEEELNKKLKKVKIAKINGSLTAEQRYVEAYDKFRDNDEYKILLGTDAMSEGINLSKCMYLIEYELADSHSTQTQRHGRLERADSIHKNVIIYQLIMTNSWDEVKEKIVSKKGKYHDYFVNGEKE